VATWLPLSLLGVERSMQATNWRSRCTWRAVGGFALSQILSIWPGQGAYYALLVVGFYALYRAFVGPPGGWRLQERLLSVARQRGVAFFAALGVATLLLARFEPTPLHTAFGLLPGFDRLTSRSPERALIIFYLAPAVLCGFTVSALRRPGAARLVCWLPLAAA